MIGALQMPTRRKLIIAGIFWIGALWVLPYIVYIIDQIEANVTSCHQAAVSPLPYVSVLFVAATQRKQMKSTSMVYKLCIQ